MGNSPVLPLPPISAAVSIICHWGQPHCSDTSWSLWIPNGHINFLLKRTQIADAEDGGSSEEGSGHTCRCSISLAPCIRDGSAGLARITTQSDQREEYAGRACGIRCLFIEWGSAAQHGQSDTGPLVSMVMAVMAFQRAPQGDSHEECH